MTVRRFFSPVLTCLLAAAAAAQAAGPAKEPPTAPQLIARLASEDVFERRNTAHLLMQSGWTDEEIGPALIAALGDSDKDVRLLAIAALAKSSEAHPGAMAAARAVAERLDDPDPDVREAALNSIGALGPIAAAVRHAARPLLTDPQANIRRSAALLLGPHRWAYDAARPVLIECLKSPNRVLGDRAAAILLRAEDSSAVPELAGFFAAGGYSHQRSEAFSILCGDEGDSPLSIPIWLTFLKAADTDPQIRITAAQALAYRKPPPASAVAALAARVADEREEPEIRYWCTEALASIGPAARPAADALAAAMRGKDPVLSGSAAVAAAEIGIRSPEAVKRLRDMLREPLARLQGATGLARIGTDSDAEAAIPILVHAVVNRGEECFLPYEVWIARDRADSAITDLARRNPKAVSALTAAAENGPLASRCAAFRVLGAVGPAARIPARLAKAHLAATAAAAKVDERDVYHYRNAVLDLLSTGAELPAAVETLTAVQSGFDSGDLLRFRERLAERRGPVTTEITAVLARMFASGDCGTRVAVVRTLRLLCPAAVCEALPPLRAALSDGCPLVRLAATETLGELGPHAAPAVPALMRLLADEDDDIRFAAAKALGNIGPAAEAAAPSLLEWTVQDDPAACSTAAESLGGIGGAQAVAALTRLLADEEGDVRWSAAAALGRAGPGAFAARHALAGLAEGDASPWVRKAAFDALDRIGWPPQGI